MQRSGARVQRLWCVRAAVENAATQARLYAVGLLALGVAWLGSAGPLQAAEPGTVINNTAELNFSMGDVTGFQVRSNTDSFSVEVPTTRAMVEILAYTPTASVEPSPVEATEYRGVNGVFTPLPAPTVPGGSSKITDQPLKLVPAKAFSSGQLMFVRVTDPDQNHDFTVRDTVDISLSAGSSPVSLRDLGSRASSESETLRLLETDVATGVFCGFVQLAQGVSVSGNGVLDIPTVNATTQALYIDSDDPDEVVEQLALVDPYGRVFDAGTGALLDGFTIHLLDADSGQAAHVYGEDGSSAFPATVVSGGQASDSSGKTYQFDPGSFRYPNVPAGRYRLEVIPPDGAFYTFPSVQRNELIEQLAAGPFVLSSGSRGNAFTVVDGPPLQLDIPLDSQKHQLFIHRSAKQKTIAEGDFVRFAVDVSNSSTETIRSVELEDRLPPGFRFRIGSTRLDGAKVGDPQPGNGRKALLFSLGDIPPGETRHLRYVASTGVVSSGELASYSHAVGNGGAIESNHARFRQWVKEDLFHSESVLMGKVLVEQNGDESAAERKLSGVAGVRVYMENGRYVVSDKQGLFHFQGVTEGSHVLRLDESTLPPQFEGVPRPRNSRFAGDPLSQFVDVSGGSLWRTDFFLRLKPRAEGDVRLAIHHIAGKASDAVKVTVELEGNSAVLRGQQLLVMLPESLEYLPGTARLSDSPFADPKTVSGILNFRLPDAAGDWHRQLVFLAHLKQDAEEGRQASKAVLLFDTPRQLGNKSPAAEQGMIFQSRKARREARKARLRLQFESLSSTLALPQQAELQRFLQGFDGWDNIAIVATGHTDGFPIRKDHKHIVWGNKELSQRRAYTVVELAQEMLGSRLKEASVKGLADKKPVADNASQKGRGRNRRVELKAEAAAQQAEMDVVPGEAKGSQVRVYGKRPGEVRAEDQGRTEKDSLQEEQPVYDQHWLDQQVSGMKWLLPGYGELPAIPSTRVLIKHPAKFKLHLYLNGSPVSALNRDKSLKSKKGVQLSAWSGVDLREGDNLLEAWVVDRSGRRMGSPMQRKVHVSGAPVEARLLKDKSTLVADGVTAPVIAVQMFDRDGYTVREHSIGEFRLEGGYRAAETDASAEGYLPEVMTGAPAQKLNYTIGKEGVARITLKPTTRVGDVHLKIPMLDYEASVYVPLRPRARDWILVGLAEGTLGYNTVSQHREALPGQAAREHLYQDGKVALFAKGRIKGKWLLTLAYDSAKKKTRSEVFKTIDPNAYYSLYADRSEGGYEATSGSKLYLKLESDEFFALFGDFDTAMTSTKLSRYSRRMNGFKSRLKKERYEVMLFRSETDQAFVRDELRGKGSTGPYSLSRKNIVLNSELVTVENRDRFHPEIINSTRTLTRYVDYDIDYDKGAITLREPLFSLSPDLHHNFLVVNFESYDEIDSSVTWGGRVVKAFGKHSTWGLTHVSEDVTGKSADMTALDMEYRLSRNTRARLELARTRGDTRDGNAWLAEIDHRGKQWNSRFSAQRETESFGLGQGNVGEQGRRSVRAETTYRLGEHSRVRAQVYEERQLGTPARRVGGELSISRDWGNTTARAGLRSVRDTLADGSRRDSDLLVAGVNHRAVNGKLNVRLEREQELGHAASLDYPQRTRLGADYKLSDTASLFADQEWGEGPVRSTRQTRVGIRTTPWKNGEVTSSVKKQVGDVNATSTNVGLRQKWSLSERWSLDAAGEHSAVVKGRGLAPLDPGLPFASGSEEGFTAFSLGLTYRPESWLWTGRIERRNADASDRSSLLTSLQFKPRQDTSLLARLNFSDTRGSEGAANEAALRFDLAHRPQKGKWLLLDRLELQRQNRNGALAEDHRKIINNISANYRASDRWQTALLFGVKYLSQDIDGSRYSGLVDLYGFESLYDLSQEWDIGIHGSLLRAREDNQLRRSTGVSLGHVFAENIWMSLGYNLVGYEEDDLAPDHQTSQGPFLRFRMKFDESFLGLLGMEQGEARR